MRGSLGLRVVQRLETETEPGFHVRSELLILCGRPHTDTHLTTRTLHTPSYTTERLTDKKTSKDYRKARHVKPLTYSYLFLLVVFEELV